MPFTWRTGTATPCSIAWTALVSWSSVPFTIPSTREAWTCACSVTLPTNPPTWSALARRVAVVAVRFSVMSFSFGCDVLNQFARGHDGRQGVQTNIIRQRHDFFLRLAGSKEHGHRKAGLHQDADGGHSNKDDQQSL